MHVNARLLLLLPNVRCRLTHRQHLWSSNICAVNSNHDRPAGLSLQGAVHWLSSRLPMTGTSAYKYLFNPPPEERLALNIPRLLSVGITPITGFLTATTISDRMFCSHCKKRRERQHIGDDYRSKFCGACRKVGDDTVLYCKFCGWSVRNDHPACAHHVRVPAGR